MKAVFNPRDPQEWQQFLELLEQAVAENKVENLMAMLLTPDERNALGLRVQIIRYLLNNQYPQREIQQRLNTSAATITRGSNQLKSMEPSILEWVNNKLNGKKA